MWAGRYVGKKTKTSQPTLLRIAAFATWDVLKLLVLRTVLAAFIVARSVELEVWANLKHDNAQFSKFGFLRRGPHSVQCED